MYTRNFGSGDRLKTHRVGSDTRILTYNAASCITQTTDTNPVTNRTYDYDTLDRLVSQSDNNGFKLWDMTPMGNTGTGRELRIWVIN